MHVKEIYIVWLMVFSAILTIFQLYRGGQVYCWRKQGDPEKTNYLCRKSLRQTLSHNVVSSTPRHGVQTHNFSGDSLRLHK